MYVNLRNAQGHITFASLTPPPNMLTEPVPSLGEVLDDFVDRWGFNTTFILNIYNARVNTVTEEQFIHVLVPVISVQEAKWLWRLVRIPADRATRIRDFSRP